MFDVLLLTVGVYLGVSPILLIIGMVGSLITWDLDGYRYRFDNITFYGREIEHAKQHLKRLFYAAASGGALAILTVTINIKPGFGLSVLFSVVSVLGLVIGIHLARRSI
jgi:hypothetical protein